MTQQIIDIWRSPVRILRAGATRWDGLLPAEGPDAQCLFCAQPPAQCACTCGLPHCGARRDECTCDVFAPPDVHERYARTSKADVAAHRRHMRALLGTTPQAAARLSAQCKLQQPRARCVICIWFTKNGHSGVCNACRNQNFIRPALRSAK